MRASTKAMIIIVAAVALSAGFSWWNQRAGDELVSWQSSLPAARAEADAARKPVLLYFTASWCGPCQWMSRHTFTDQQVARQLDGFVPVKIDIDADRATAASFEIRAVPTFIVLAADGEAPRSTSGRMTADEFTAWLEPSSPAATGG